MDGPTRQFAFLRPVRTGEQARGGIVAIVGIKVAVRVGLGVFVAVTVDVEVDVGVREGVEVRVFVMVVINVEVAGRRGANDDNAA